MHIELLFECHLFKHLRNSTVFDTTYSSEVRISVLRTLKLSNANNQDVHWGLFLRGVGVFLFGGGTEERFSSAANETAISVPIRTLSSIRPMFAVT